MQMDEGLDTGAVLFRAETDITGTDTASTLHDRLALLGRETLLKALSESHVAIPQSEEGSCYAPVFRERTAKSTGSVLPTRLTVRFALLRPGPEISPFWENRSSASVP